MDETDDYSTPAPRRPGAVPDALDHLDPVRRHFLRLDEVPPVTALPQLLRRASAVMDAAVLESVHQRGWRELTDGDLKLLDSLRDRTVPISTLAELLGVSHQAVSRRVTDLVARGMATKDQGWQDVRVVLVRLTARGRAAVRALDESVDEALGFVVDDIPAEHLERLLVHLTVLAQELPGA
ncbi:MarR family winged helix-turn-helix transcriptional regulator [Luteipulveratus halotolerans]|uniref:HTH marR-type domain-containing protein n=1 Tax=Luteipulveratus halotolerans TaxID=1631356 RepID=A0A0L6CFF9_9MICO|nr:MarR family transcriptional regulator [Luteipulveratus halotolerans]KNX36273.1 hypothetical protein VV01_02535 [Luteipulveratus halotolerans]